MTQQLEGRVFDRLRRFSLLSKQLRQDTVDAETYLTIRTDVFTFEHTKLLKSVWGIRGKDLVVSLNKWLNVEKKKEKDEEQHQSDKMDEQRPEIVVVDTTTRSEAREPLQSPSKKTNDTQAYAKEIAQALVLHGYLTLYKEDDEHEEQLQDQHQPADEWLNDNDLLVPIAKYATDRQRPCVWNLVDGAIYAKWLKRKAGLLGKITQGKGVYIVANHHLKAVYLFDSDLARECIAEFPAPYSSVEYDTSGHFEFGVQLTITGGSGDDTKEYAEELLNAQNKIEQDALVHALVSVGLRYRESAASQTHLDQVQSIYELCDVDINGNNVKMQQFHGKVLLIVNVPSLSVVATTNYPELLEMEQKYRDQGLLVLAFISDQFDNVNPSIDDTIVELPHNVQKNFTLFRKADVNGPNARPVFAYLKHKLPSVFGEYVDWNFTKYLIDRQGQPISHFAPEAPPHAMEAAVQQLLNREA